MVLNGFDSVKAMKSIAMDFSRRRKLKWLFEFFLFFFLVSHRSSLFSLAAPALRHFFRRLVLVFNSHIFVFVVFHSMLFVVYSLSRLTDNKSGSNRTDAESGIAASGGESAEILVASVENSVAEILVVEEKNIAATVAVDGVPIDETLAAEPTPAPDSTVPHLTEIHDGAEPMPTPAAGATVRLLTETHDGAGPTRTPAAEITVRHLKSLTETADIIPEIKRYRRTESERFEENRETSKFRRSKTEIDRRKAGREAAGFLNSVDEMDIDDFNRRVESFIAEQKMHIRGRNSG